MNDLYLQCLHISNVSLLFAYPRACTEYIYCPFTTITVVLQDMRIAWFPVTVVAWCIGCQMPAIHADKILSRGQDGIRRAKVKTVKKKKIPLVKGKFAYYKAGLNGTNSSALSTMTLAKDTYQLNLAISVNLVGADVLTAMNQVVSVHIHKGNATEKGPLVWILCGAPPAPACTQTSKKTTYVGYPFPPYGAKNASKLLLDGTPTYVNLHTTLAPGGLIRGQVKADKKKKGSSIL